MANTSNLRSNYLKAKREYKRLGEQLAKANKTVRYATKSKKAKKTTKRRKSNKRK